MVKFKHIVHFSLSGGAFALMFYSWSCLPEPDSNIVKIVRDRFNLPCEILSYKIEPEGIPNSWNVNTYPPLAVSITGTTTTSGVSQYFTYTGTASTGTS